MADGSTTVVAKIKLPRGTTFGPLYAKRIWTMNPLTRFPIRVFGNTQADTYHLDYSHEHNSNWMCFVEPASNAKEQNLICYQVRINALIIVSIFMLMFLFLAYQGETGYILHSDEDYSRR